MTPPRAVVFDFNGTISDDEPLIDELFRAVLADEGLALTSDQYWEELAGLSDPEIVVRALELNGVDPTPARRDAIIRTKVDRYKAAVTASPTIGDEVARALREAAARVPIAIASGSFREEVEHVLAISGLRDLFAAVVCIDDVEHGKPDPAGFLLALDGLPGAVAPADVLVVEDANAGVRAARAAGMRVVGIRNRALTEHVDTLIDALDPPTMRRLLDGD